MRTAGTTAFVLGALLGTGSAASAAPSYTNCTSYNKTFPHGVGRADAHDKTTGTPVTTFRRDSAEYKRAMSRNGGLDRDKDGIACEKR